MKDGFCHTPEHKTDAHAGTYKHGIPAECAEFRHRIRSSDFNIAIFTCSEQDHDNNKKIGRQNIQPAKIVADAVQDALKKK